MVRIQFFANFHFPCWILNLCGRGYNSMPSIYTCPESENIGTKFKIESFGKQATLDFILRNMSCDPHIWHSCTHIRWVCVMGQGYYRSRIVYNLFFMFQHLGSPLAFSSFIIHVPFLILRKNIEFMIIFLFAEHVGSGPPAPFSAVGPLAPRCPCAQWHVCSTGGQHFAFFLWLYLWLHLHQWILSHPEKTN